MLRWNMPRYLAGLFSVLLLGLLPGSLAAGEPFFLSDLTADAMPHTFGAVSVGTDGTKFLAVWEISRTAIWGAKLDAAGNLLGETFPVIPFGIEPTSPTLLWTGSSYVLVWNEGVFLDPRLHFAEVDRDGRVLRRATSTMPLFSPRLAWDGPRLLLVGRTAYGAPQSGIRAVLLDREWSIAVRDIPIWDDAMATYDAIATPSGFLVTTRSYSGLLAHRISPEGELLGSTILQPGRGMTGGAYGPLFVQAHSNRDTLVVWTAAADGTSSELKSAFVTPEGEARSVRVLPTAGHNPNGFLDLESTGSGYVIVFATGRRDGSPDDRFRLFALRLSESGESLSSEPAFLAEASSHSRFAGVATIAASHLATFLELTPFAEKITGLPFSSERGVRVSPPRVVSQGPTHQNSPSVSADGYGSLAVWREKSALWLSIYFGRIDRHGNRLDGRGVPLRQEGSVGAPAVASDGVDSLVVWPDRGILGTRINARGEKIDSHPLVIRNGSTAHVAVIWNGENFFVVWREQNSSREQPGIWGTLVTSSGIVSPAVRLSPNIPPSERELVDEGFPQVAWNGREFLVAWTVARTPPCPGIPCGPIWSYETVSVRVSQTGQPLDQTATQIGRGNNARVSSDGNEFLASFSDSNGLWGRVLRTNAGRIEPAEPFRIFSWWDSLTGELLWNGERYVVIFSYSDRTGRLWSSFKFVNRGGVVRPETYGVESEAMSEDVVVGPAGELLMVGSRYVRDIQASRVVGKVLDDATLLGPAPAAPARVKVTRLNEVQHLVTWADRSNNELGFVVEVRIGDKWRNVAYAPANSVFTTFFYSGYEVRVRAWNEGGASEPSDLAVVSPPRRRSSGH